MNSARLLFLLACGFGVALFMFYLSFTINMADPDAEMKLLLQNERYLEKQREAAEKIRIEGKVWEEYENWLMLNQTSQIRVRTFRSDGNITRHPKKPFLFVHVPKTAGSTLSSVFKRNERPSRFLHTWAQPHLYDMPKVAAKDTVFGHFRYGLHFYFRRNCTYMTVLREPVDRVVSHYYFHIQHKKDPGHAFAMNHTFEEWVRESPSGNNEQTRMISGIRSEFNITRKTLDMAKHHLMEMAVVGLTEKYQETLMLLKYIAGFNIVKYRAINKGVKRPKTADVSKKTIELIKKHNWADLELYDLAKEIYDAQVAAMPPAFQKDLDNFEKLMKKKKPKL